MHGLLHPLLLLSSFTLPPSFAFALLCSIASSQIDMMPRDLPRPAVRRRKTPFRVSKPSFGLLLGIASTVLIVCLAVLLSGQLLLSVLPQLCAAVRCCLLRRYIFFAVNFMVLLLVLLKLADRESGEEVTGGGGARSREVSHDEWFDALSSPTPFGDVITEDEEQYSSTPASPLEVPLSDAIAEVGKSGLLVSFLAPFPDFTATKASESRTPASFLELADSSTGGSGSDEFYSCPPTPSRSPVSTSPVTAVAVATVKPSPPAEEAEDSMGATATWKVICRRVTAALHLKTAAWGRPRKSERLILEVAGDSMDATWRAITGVATAPPSVEAVVLSAARAQLRKSETLQLEEAAAGARRAVLEKRMRGREVAIVEDCDEMMNRRFDTFIQNFNEQLRLQRLASLRRRRYMDMHEHPLLCN